MMKNNSEQLAIYRELSPAELAACLAVASSAKEKLAAYQEMDKLIGTLPVLEPEAWLQTAFNRSLESRSQLSFLVRLPAIVGQATAVTLLVLLLIAVWFLFSLPTNPELEETAVSPLDIVRPTLASSISCPISPTGQIWAGTSTMAGEFPVWMTSWGRQGVTLLSDVSGTPVQVSEGVWSRALLLVDEDVKGDLMITGQQLDGQGRVYFLHRVDEETITWEPQHFIPNAHTSEIIQKPDGRVQHFTAWGVTGPGCYQLTFTLAEYTVQMVVEVIDVLSITPSPSK